MPASRSASAPNDGWFNYVPYAARAYNPGPNIDFYALGMILLGISTTVGRGQFHRDASCALRAPGMSINRVPILIWGTLTASRRQYLRRPGGQPRLLPAVDGPPVRHAFLRCRRGRPAAAVAASVLDVRPSLGLCHRAAGDGHGVGRRCRCSAAGRWSATRRWRWRRSRPWCSASACGCTTCSPPACRALALSFFSAASHHHRGAERGRRCSPGSRRSGRGRPVFTTAFLFFAELHRAVRHRRRVAAS